MLEPCPLCGATDGVLVSRTSYDEIFEALRDRFGGGVDDELVCRYRAADTADEYCCEGCGLHRFSPLNPGGPDFYDALASSDRYYRSERWDYELALAQLHRPGLRVLDIGCGRGDFLAMAREAGAEVFGAETNPEAHAHLGRRSIPFHSGDVDELDDTFDVICGFQILEHLPRIDQVVAPARRRLRPGGLLFFTVPNRDRLPALPSIEPLDAPPHHVSRWSAAQFDELARRHRLRVRAVHRQRRAPLPTAKVVWHRVVGRSRRSRVGLRDLARRSRLGMTMAVALEPSEGGPARVS